MKKKTDILIVDDAVDNLTVLDCILENPQHNIIKAMSGNEALGLMLEHNFALVLLDVQMPGMDGIETAELMRVSERTKYIPIIFVTANSKDQMNIFKGYEVGAVDYLFKPIEPTILKSKVRVFIELYKQKELLRDQATMLEEKIRELTELKVTNRRLESLSYVDGLTGISNRRSFDNFIGVHYKNFVRKRQPLSLIMIDIDNFKDFNDNYGHLKGDDCLILVGNCLEDNIKRPTDFVARYGGEEFAIVLPDTDSKGAQNIANLLREKIEDLEIKHERSKTSKYVTISLGVATLYPKNEFESIEWLINNADKALYKAKNNGRNRVEIG